MTDPQFFGFGSLVNLSTHTYGGKPATLRDWRRCWVTTTFRDHAFLSVTPCEASQIDGVLANVPNGDWAALDEREKAYERIDVTHQIKGAFEAAVYQVSPQNVTQSGEGRILLSYLDVVIQGYVTQFGEKGVASFFETTDGWHHGIQDDRHDPIYPRAQILTPSQTALVDTFLARL